MSHRLFLLAALGLALPAAAQVRITEWQYNGDEYIEFTNVGAAPVDMTGWSFDDDSRVPGTVSLSAFGMLMPGKSAILAESPASTFASNWRLSGVPIIGDNTTNLGRADEINLYDASQALVDRLTYGDVAFPGSIRTQDVSGSPCHGALGQNDVYAWSFAFVGDQRGSVASVAGQIGNPGSYVAVSASLATFGAGCAGSASKTPVLTARGCPTPGGQVLLAVGNGLASAPGVLVFGSARGAVAIGACTLHAFPLLVQLPFALDAAGMATFTLPVPKSAPAVTLTTQVFLLDAGAVDGFSSSNAAELMVR